MIVFRCWLFSLIHSRGGAAAGGARARVLLGIDDELGQYMSITWLQSTDGTSAAEQDEPLLMAIYDKYKCTNTSKAKV